MTAGNAYPSGHLVPSSPLGTCLCSNCWYQLSWNCRVFLDFTPWIVPLGTFSILLKHTNFDMLLRYYNHTDWRYEWEWFCIKFVHKTFRHHKHFGTKKSSFVVRISFLFNCTEDFVNPNSFKTNICDILINVFILCMMVLRQKYFGII